LLQNVTGTHASDWHKTDTKGSRDVPAPAKENAAPVGAGHGVNDLENGSHRPAKHTLARGQSAMSKYAKDAHKRSARMLGYALTMGDSLGWQGFRKVISARLTETERAGLAFAALSSLPEESALKVVEAVLEGAGMPLPPLLDPMGEADLWADMANPAELDAYCWAAFRRMRPHRQHAFLDFISGRAAI